MDKRTAINMFLESCPNAKQETIIDYCKIQLEWSIFVDMLCKNGEITQKQYNNWTFPFGE